MVQEANQQKNDQPVQEANPSHTHPLSSYGHYNQERIPGIKR